MNLQRERLKLTYWKVITILIREILVGKRSWVLTVPESTGKGRLSFIIHRVIIKALKSTQADIFKDWDCRGKSLQKFKNLGRIFDMRVKKME